MKKLILLLSIPVILPISLKAEEKGKRYFQIHVGDEIILSCAPVEGKKAALKYMSVDAKVLAEQGGKNANTVKSPRVGSTVGKSRGKK